MIKTSEAVFNMATNHVDIREKSNEKSKRNIEQEADASVATIGLVTFVGDGARGILFPVLWPLCQSLHGNKVDYGEIIC